MITLYDLASYIVDHPAVCGHDYIEAGLPIFGGCEVCHASVGPTAYPSQTGFIRCSEHIDNLGFTDCEEAYDAIFGTEYERQD